MKTIYHEDAQTEIYFVETDVISIIKIGASQDVARRMQTLQAMCPVDLTLVRSLPAPFALETALHRKFEDSRYRGEWFHKTPELTQFITQLCADQFDDLIHEFVTLRNHPGLARS